MTLCKKAPAQEQLINLHNHTLKYLYLLVKLQNFDFEICHMTFLFVLIVGLD
jgi:hypothetical protein